MRMEIKFLDFLIVCFWIWAAFKIDFFLKLPKIRVQGHTQVGSWIQFYCLWIQETDASENNEHKTKTHKFDKETEYITKV